LGRGERMNIKHALAVVMLGIGGSIALYMEQNEIAAFCFGAIASWGLVNGVQKTVT